MTGGRSAGQAALDLLAAVPLLLGAALLAWQLAAIVMAGIQGQEEVRRRALGATGPPGRVITVRTSVRVPALLPGLSGLEVPARAEVRAP